MPIHLLVIGRPIAPKRCCCQVKKVVSKGACTPFLFYDLDFEVQTPLMIHPYQLMDFSLLKHSSFLDKKETLEKAIQEVKNVNGVFTPIFHNYTFSGWDRWSDFKTLFNIILDSKTDVSA